MAIEIVDFPIEIMKILPAPPSCAPPGLQGGTKN